MALRPFFVPGLCTIRYLTRAFLGSPRGRQARRVTGQTVSFCSFLCVLSWYRKSFPSSIFEAIFGGGDCFLLLYRNCYSGACQPRLSIPHPSTERTSIRSRTLPFSFPLDILRWWSPPHAACCITDNISIFLAARPLPLSTKLHSKPQTAVLCCCC